MRAVQARFVGRWCLTGRSCSPRSYGNHVSVQDIARHLAPSADVVRAVVAWASAGGAGEARVSVTGDYVFAATPAAVLEELFGVDMHVFRHTRTSSQLVRAATHLPVVPASVPEGLKAAISAVVGVADFPVDARRIGASTEAPETTAVKVTPPVIWSAYGLESAPKSFTTAEASQSVAEFEQAYFYPSGACNITWLLVPGCACEVGVAAPLVTLPASHRPELIPEDV